MILKGRSASSSNVHPIKKKEYKKIKNLSRMSPCRIVRLVRDEKLIEDLQKTPVEDGATTQASCCLRPRRRRRNSNLTTNTLDDPNPFPYNLPLTRAY